MAGVRPQCKVEVAGERCPNLGQLRRTSKSGKKYYQKICRGHRRSFTKQRADAQAQ